MGIFKKKKAKMEAERSKVMDEGRHHQHHIKEGAQFCQVTLAEFNAFGKGRKLKRFEYEHEVAFTENDVEIMLIDVATRDCYIRTDLLPIKLGAPE